jgi:hypothetical protein
MGNVLMEERSSSYQSNSFERAAQAVLRIVLLFGFVFFLCNTALNLKQGKRVREQRARDLYYTKLI